MNSTEWQKIKEVFNATLDLPENEHTLFLSKYDVTLRREVQKLLNAHENANNFIVEPAFVDVGFTDDSETDLYVGKQIDEYKILAEIGHGGMGTVYLASRSGESFDKKVAIKLIKRGMDTNAVLKRFVMERQILAQLENQNIASLIDGGSTADGLPYLVMEYIEGEPITKFCDSHQFSIEERLELFRKVCAAVSYAHQNLVVHRDIKPSNILVTSDGTPKLLDFGIAKLLHPDWSLDTAEATATMFRLMTPEYASPEQIRGLPITTASDVYSLGVVLYELLSGERPYKIESRLPQEVANVILTEEPIKPSSVVSRQSLIDSNKTTSPNAQRTNDKRQPTKFLKGDLDNIILKALRKEPERRYQTVQEFSEDIRRHLVGLPVTATADTTFYRVGKFVKRHRVGVFASLFMFLSLLTGISVAIWQAVEARKERAKAEQRFNDVRKLTNSFLFEFHDAIENLSGATPARKLVIERALPFLDNLVQEAGNDDSLQNELAESYRKLGEIQGHPTFPNIGDVAGGIESFRKSIKIGEQLVQRNPTNQDYRFNLAKYYDMLGDMYNDATYDTPNALANYQKALGLREKLRAENAEYPDLLTGLLMSYERVGNIKAKTGDLNGAIKDYRASLEIAEQLQASQPTTNKLQRNIYISYYEIGKVLHADAKYREALEQYAKGRPLIVNSITIEPNNADLPRTLGVSDDLSANAHLELGEIEAATSFSNNALAIREKLFAADPTNIQVYGDLTVSLDTAGDLRVKAGDIAGGLKLLHRSLEMREAALKQDPTMTLAKRYIAISRNKIAVALRAQNDLTSALAEQQQALNGNRELARDDSTNLELRRELAVSLQGTGEILALIAVKDRNPNKWREARELLEESRKIYEEMQSNNQAFGADTLKLTALKVLIEKQGQLFSH